MANLSHALNDAQNISLYVFSLKVDWLGVDVSHDSSSPILLP